MKNDGLKNLFLAFFLLILIAYGSYSFGRQGYELKFNDRIPSVKISHEKPPDASVDFSLFWQAYELLNRKYISSPLDPKKLLYGALHGLYGAAGDPYTVFLTPEENKSVTSSLSGKYEGIGAELGLRNCNPEKGQNECQLIVVSPLDGSPAKMAGIKAGDAILKIDGKETAGITLSEAVNKIRGPVDSRVILTIRHAVPAVPTVALLATEAAKFLPSREVALTRAAIKVESVKWEIKEEGVAYVRVSRFGDSTDDEWDTAVANIKSQIPNVKSVIIDLRGNPGGYFPTAIHIGSEFIDGGLVSSQSFAHGVKQDFKVDHPGKFLKVPGVVLVNEGSASASEIVAGALRDRRGFKIVGTKSFGKGTVQAAENFSDGSGAHITEAEWLTPNGYNIHGSGINPDVKVEVSDEQINNGQDPQLNKALELANKL